MYSNVKKKQFVIAKIQLVKKKQTKHTLVPATYLKVIYSVCKVESQPNHRGIENIRSRKI